MNNAVADLIMMSHRRAGQTLSDILPMYAREDRASAKEFTCFAGSWAICSLCPGVQEEHHLLYDLVEDSSEKNNDTLTELPWP